MDVDRIAALELRLKALEADTDAALRRTVELSRLVVDLSATLREVAELGTRMAETVFGPVGG